MVQQGEEEGEKKICEVDVTSSQSAQAAQGMGDVSALSCGLKGQSEGFFFFRFFLKETRSEGVELLGRVMQEETDTNSQRSSERISMFLIFCHDTQLLQSRSLCLLREAHCVNKG